MPGQQQEEYNILDNTSIYHLIGTQKGGKREEGRKTLPPCVSQTGLMICMAETPSMPCVIDDSSSFYLSLCVCECPRSVGSLAK